MTGRAPHTKNMSEQDRLAKNARIKTTSLATRTRRKTMVVQVRELKIVTNKLTVGQREDLARLFLEAKWVRNAALGSQRFDLDYLKELAGQVPVRLPDETYESRPLQVLGGQLAQAVITELKQNLASLKALKKNGRRVGKLKFAREVTSINLAQFSGGRTSGTHKINRANGTIKVANIRGWMKASGLHQLDAVDEIANAKIVSRPDGYFLLVTTYTHPRPNLGRATQDFQPGTEVGIDMGVKTHVTLSNGRKFDAMFEETDRLRRLRRKLARQTKGSANYRKTKHQICRESARVTRRREDCANKFVHELLRNERVYLQDENISSWKTRTGWVRGGKRVHSSILGRVKAKLANHDRVIMLNRWAATTATCICGTKTPHDVSQRVFTCTHCGYTEDRDTHAAQNMIRLGPEPNPTRPEQTETPVEIGVRPVAAMNFTFMPHTGIRSTKQEAATSSGLR